MKERLSAWQVPLLPGRLLIVARELVGARLRQLGNLLACAYGDLAEEDPDATVPHQAVEVLPGPILEDTPHVPEGATESLQALPLGQVLKRAGVHIRLAQGDVHRRGFPLRVTSRNSRFLHL
ncbi:hypothetical protein ACFVFI_27525 [Streptomyces sp. NPDC057705]|uniref:hypothetical protein n=1 Tax=Streptomyces sp. NPDC057705 TaxID=3346222 RepID=UPI003698F82F